MERNFGNYNIMEEKMRNTIEYDMFFGNVAALRDLCEPLSVYGSPTIEGQVNWTVTWEVVFGYVAVFTVNVCFPRDH